MERSERETNILINEEDMANGFFYVTTTNRTLVTKLKRLVGSRKWEELDVIENKAPNGRVLQWTIKMPAAFWSGVAIRRPRSKKNSPVLVG